MKQVKIAATGILIFLMICPGIWAGESGKDRFKVGINFSPVFPVGEFKDNFDLTLYGGHAYFLWRIPRSIVSVGASFGIAGRLLESREEPFSETIPDVYVDVETVNYVLTCHAMVRVQPRGGWIKPYLDGLFGFQYLWTETGVYDHRQSLWEIAGDVNQDAWALSYGAGAGVEIGLLKKKKFELMIEFGARVLMGGKADYLTKGSIVRFSDLVFYYPTTSKTDLVTAHVGVTVAF